MVGKMHSPRIADFGEMGGLQKMPPEPHVIKLFGYVSFTLN